MYHHNKIQVVHIPHNIICTVNTGDYYMNLWTDVFVALVNNLTRQTDEFILKPSIINGRVYHHAHFSTAGEPILINY